MNKYAFQYCQKLVILSADGSKALLCKRQGESDYDGMYAFAGGKMEITDNSIVESMQREKNEELGADFKIKLLPKYSINILFTKSDGSAMVVPHYLAYHKSGTITLNEEYSHYEWVALDELEEFEPKVPNILQMVQGLQRLANVATEDDFVLV